MLAERLVEAEEVLAWLEANGSAKERAGMTRFNVPNERAYGVPIGALKAHAKKLGRSHGLARSLWDSGSYEARTLAALIDDPLEVNASQMNRWARDFDSWAICDTTCFHLFDRTALAWSKVDEWAKARQEFVKRASYALIWSLSVHDKKASDAKFIAALELIEHSGPEPRPLVRSAVDMALRATGKRNASLNRAARRVAGRMTRSQDKDTAWIGTHALSELTSAKVQSRFE